jgi:hypothetical protein
MFVFTQSNQTGMELRLDLDLQLDQIMNNGEIQNPRHIYIYIYIYIYVSFNRHGRRIYCSRHHVCEQRRPSKTPSRCSLRRIRQVSDLSLFHRWLPRHTLHSLQTLILSRN